jgi:hypothetical protein
MGWGGVNVVAYVFIFVGLEELNGEEFFDMNNQRILLLNISYICKH